MTPVCFYRNWHFIGHHAKAYQQYKHCTSTVPAEIVESVQ